MGGVDVLFGLEWEGFCQRVVGGVELQGGYSGREVRKFGIFV